MRAHANCVENLPLYTAVALAATAVGKAGAVLDALAVAFLAGRVLQTTVHVALEETPPAVAVRFAFFAVQLVCLAWMGAHVAPAA